MILQIGCPSSHLISWRKSALIQKPSVKTLKAFYQHGTTEKTKIIRYKCFNVTKWIAYPYWKQVHFVRKWSIKSAIYKRRILRVGKGPETATEKDVNSILVKPTSNHIRELHRKLRLHALLIDPIWAEIKEYPQ